ncbi:MAG: type II toxin-antitoxin system PemK/MazF family toxin [Eggerthellaceae bacterium]|nr:type II toxin-antitoxin system PemK/MazF family toxin [Eggerthellaceae bacterium]
MTLSISDISPFDVLIAVVRFEDAPKGYKARPVVALNVDDGALTVAAVKVTSHAPRDWCFGEVRLLDWQREGLARPSVARCSQRLLLRASDIGKRVGSLTERDRAAVVAALREG